MLDASKLKSDILSDMRVELSDEFDRNFERKAFFSDKWKPRAHDYPQRRLPHSCRLFVPKNFRLC